MSLFGQRNNKSCIKISTDCPTHFNCNKFLKKFSGSVITPQQAYSYNTIFSSFFFFRKNYLLLSCATSVRPSVEIISFRGNSLSIRPIDLKIGLNVREGVVHVRKAWFFEIRIASCNFLQFMFFILCLYKISSGRQRCDNVP